MYELIIRYIQEHKWVLKFQLVFKIKKYNVNSLELKDVKITNIVTGHSIYKIHLNYVE